MTQPATVRRSGRNRFVGCLLVAIFLLLILGIGGAVAVTQIQPPDVFGLQVHILAPLSGEIAEVNRPVTVNASANYAAGLTRLELYVDGALVAAQQSPTSQTTNDLTLAREWLPKTIGRHILVARAYGRDNVKADSPIDYIDVVELAESKIQIKAGDIPRPPYANVPTLRQIAASQNIPLAQLQGTNPSLNSMNPDMPLPPDTPLDFPRRPAPEPAPGAPDMAPIGDDPGAVPPVPLPGTPAAPTNLVATADCTTARLTWAGSSSEEQYIVYRLRPNDILLDPIATLPQKSTSFRDTPPEPGTYRYQVAAVRGGVEGLSPMATVDTPEACVSPTTASGTTNLVLALVSLQTDDPREHVYCYLSIDGSVPERVPTGDFQYLVPDASDARHFRYDLGRQPVALVPNRGQIALPGHQAGTPVSVTGDCWGSASGENAIAKLGTVSLDAPPEQWDGSTRELSFGAVRLQYVVGADTPRVRSDIAGRAFGIRVTAGDMLRPHLNIEHGLTRLKGGGGVVILSPVLLRVDWSRDACGDILPTDSRITTEQRIALLACILFGVQTAQWDWDPWVDLNPSDVLEYKVEIVSISTASDAWDYTLDRRNILVRPGSHKKTIVPPPPCSTATTYSVSARTQINGESFWTMPSNRITLTNNTPCRIEVTVTFDQLTVGPFHHPCFLCSTSSVPSTIQFAASRTDGTQRQLLTQLLRKNHPEDDGGVWFGQGTFPLSRRYWRADVVSRVPFANPWRDSLQLLYWGTDLDTAAPINHLRVYLDEPGQGVDVWGQINDRGFYPFVGRIEDGALSTFSYCRFGPYHIGARPFDLWDNSVDSFQISIPGSPDYADYCKLDGTIYGRKVRVPSN